MTNKRKYDIIIVQLKFKKRLITQELEYIFLGNKGEISMGLSGGKLAGGNPKNMRIENDFYATNPKAVEMLLLNYSLNGTKILEPCVGNGNIANAIKSFYNASINITGIDIVDRGYPNTIVEDFLTYKTEEKYDCVVTNPPFSLAQEFIEKSLELVKEGYDEDGYPRGQVIMFLKIQFLEGQRRKEFFKKYPPKYIYVFRNRMATWNNGEEFDIDEITGKRKKWATTMCHAWFVWEKGSTSEPVIRWL